MTTSTQAKLICDCGHQGYLRRSEEGQSGRSPWESFTLEGFDGKSSTVTISKAVPKDLLGYMQPICPRCGRTGRVSYARGTDERDAPLCLNDPRDTFGHSELTAATTLLCDPRERAQEE